MSGVERRVGDSIQQQDAQNDIGLDMSVEARARRMGWYPKEEFRGPPENWRPATEYLERAEREMPVLRASLRALETHAATIDARSRTQAETVAKLNETVDTLGKSLDALRDMNAKAEERGFARALENFKKQATAAAAEGDADAVAKAMDGVKQLVEQRAEVVSKTTPAAKAEPKPNGQQTQQPQSTQEGGDPPDPVAQAWANAPERAWYRENRAMGMYASAVFQELHDTRRDMSTAEKLAETERQVAERWPTSHYFADRPKGLGRAEVDPPTVNKPSGGDRTGSEGKNSEFDKLPKEAKEAYANIAASTEERRKRNPNIKPYTKEEFLRVYEP